jgi:hypothetical protein
MKKTLRSTGLCIADLPEQVTFNARWNSLHQRIRARYALPLFFFSSTSTVRVLTPRQNFSFSVVSQGTGSAAKAAISRPHRSRFQRRLFRFFFSRVVIRPFLPPKRPSSSGIASRLHELVIASLSWANHRQLLSQLPCNDPERQVGGGRWVI